MDDCQLTIPLLSEKEFLALSPRDRDIFLKLYREQVAPKFEEWRNPHRIKMAHGGRGAGAKSWSADSLLIQFGEDPAYFGDSVRVLCTRYVQKSIKESSWLLLGDTISRLGYKDWKVTDKTIINQKNGSYFAFNGLNDMTKDDLKSYESFDILFVEEAASIPKSSWRSILATFRKPKSEIWGLFNRDLTLDPCYELFCLHPEPNWSILDLKPGAADNPWWYQTLLQREWDKLKEEDPDEAMHVYEGMPRVQGSRAVFSRLQITGIKDREILEEGAIEIGCDVARFGKDSTQAYKRHGLKVIEHKECRGFDTIAVAGMLWDMADRRVDIPIKIDVGYNPGVIDILRSWGANVVSVGFGDVAMNPDKYANAATEMMFEIPIDQISIPAEMVTQTLVEDLTERYYGYDAKGRKKIEPKDSTATVDNVSQTNFKGRHGGRSPDEGDALGLCFYHPNISIYDVL